MTEDKRNELNRKVILDEILKRYGIHPSDQPQKPRPAVATVKVDPPLDLGWRWQPEKPTVAAVVHQAEPNLDSQSELLTETVAFHFLVRIVECSVTLHCQVMAESTTKATHLVQQIPNLIESRQISLAELATLMEAENR